MKIVPLTLVQTPGWEGTVTLLHGTSVGHDPLGAPWGLCECGTLGAARSCVFWQSRWGHVRAVWAVGLSDGWEDWLRSGGGWRSPSWLGSVYQILDWTRAKKRIWKSGWGVRWVLDVVPAWQERVRVRLFKRVEGSRSEPPCRGRFGPVLLCPERFWRCCWGRCCWLLVV